MAGSNPVRGRKKKPEPQSDPGLGSLRNLSSYDASMVLARFKVKLTKGDPLPRVPAQSPYPGRQWTRRGFEPAPSNWTG